MRTTHWCHLPLEIREEFLEVLDTFGGKGNGGHFVDVPSGSIWMAMSRNRSSSSPSILATRPMVETELGAAIDQAARSTRVARGQCQGSSSCNRETG